MEDISRFGLFGFTDNNVLGAFQLFHVQQICVGAGVTMISYLPIIQGLLDWAKAASFTAHS